MTRGYMHDERGVKSSKRLVGVWAAFTLVGLYALHVMVTLAIALKNATVPPPPDPTLGGIVAALAFGTLGLTSVDKRSPQAVAEADITKARATAELRAVDG